MVSAPSTEMFSTEEAELSLIAGLIHTRQAEFVKDGSCVSAVWK